MNLQRRTPATVSELAPSREPTRSRRCRSFTRRADREHPNATTDSLAAWMDTSVGDLVYDGIGGQGVNQVVQSRR